MAIKYLVMDVDGTLTDGKIYMGQNGELVKAFNIKDGLGIHDILPSLGIIPVIITGRQSKILENRCREIGIEKLFQGVHEKDSCLVKIASDFREVAYIGDDLNDLTVMSVIKKSGGIVCCPADAADEVKNISDYVCHRSGGDGAVRECIEWLRKRQAK